MGIRRPGPGGRLWALRHAHGQAWQSVVPLLLAAAIFLTIGGVSLPAFSVEAFPLPPHSPSIISSYTHIDP